MPKAAKPLREILEAWQHTLPEDRDSHIELKSIDGKAFAGQSGLIDGGLAEVAARCWLPQADGDKAVVTQSSASSKAAAMTLSRSQRPRVKTTPDQGDDRDEHPTTLVLKALPHGSTTQSVKRSLDSLGFAGSYDFLYQPFVVVRGHPLPYAFVNFITSQDASAFAAAVAEIDCKACTAAGLPRQVEWAKEQGLDRALAHCMRKGFHKIRSEAHRPWAADPSRLPIPV
mmetsp:Transcript_6143/g.13635  ORF Transcript_6143/g.13635 Transcript_6143/m.13635 type:complete len:228 (-) Transcript_6143:21-704(-)